jgi:hypothetical protein
MGARSIGNPDLCGNDARINRGAAGV